MISRFFIDRPVFSIVMSIVIVLAGLASIRVLPIAQYPSIVPPEVVVSASYPGTNAETVGTTVAAPLEQEINGVDKMIYMNSTSTSTGTYRLSVTFEIGTNPDQATINVNNRVKAAESRLPEDVRRQGVRVEKRSTNILQVITLTSPGERYGSVFLSNFALLNVIDELKRVPGVGDASLFGAEDYSMRIWLRPDKLAQYDLTPADVATAIREQNAQFATGRFGQEPMPGVQAFTYSASTRGRMVEPSEFGSIILRSDARGGTLRLRDVARIELGAENYTVTRTHDGEPAATIGVYPQPGANALATAALVRAKMTEVSKSFPEGINYSIPFDTTKFVDRSIKEVLKTLAEAIVLVVLVVYLFLQNIRATIIPVLAIPVSIVGTFAGMYLLGFSINLLTLFGLVLAIGIVVDDAIVVIENVERLMREEKLEPKAAALRAMDEVAGPVVAIVLVLSAVFIPVAFLGGLAGEMYRQFAVTIAVSVTISGIVALTLTPALCAAMLRPIHGEPALPFRWFNAFFNKMTNGYLAGATFMLKRWVIGLLLFAGLVGVTAAGFQKLPASLVPPEDQGYVLLVYNLPPASSLDRTKALTAEMTKRVMGVPAVDSIVTLTGFDILTRTESTSAGVSFAPLKDWSLRTKPEDDARKLVGRFMGLGASLQDGVTVAFNPAPIIGMSTTGGFEGYVQNKGGATIQELGQTVEKLIQAANARPEITGARSTFSVRTPQYYISLDREKARALDIPIDQVFATMQATFGSFYVNDFTQFGRNYRVNLQSEADFRRSPDDLRHVFVRSKGGNLVPLDSLVTVKRVIGPDVLERFNVFPAAKILGNPAPGYSSGQALAAMEAVAAEVLDRQYALGWIGSSYQEKATAGTGSMAFIFGIIMVFLILAAQYERWSLPLVVITSVPFAVFGAVAATWLRGLDNDLYFQVGLVTLIGLSAKNAILIVEFAILHRRTGASVIEAALESARLRFRPIIMTSLAFAVGAVPLAISTGAGASSRHAIGTGVIGGIAAATCIATFFVPMFFRLIIRLTEGKEKDPAAEPTPAPQAGED